MRMSAALREKEERPIVSLPMRSMRFPHPSNSLSLRAIKSSAATTPQLPVPSRAAVIGAESY
jgi:hypothetical protein